MVPLFLGLSAANLLLLAGVFGLGIFALGGDGKPGGAYSYHVSLGIAAGLMTTLTHLAAYMYFMATSRWLQAATDKAALDPARFAAPSLANKRRALPVVMAPIVLTMIAMFSGAGADPTAGALWSGEAHMVIAGLAIVANGACAFRELMLIREQGRLMDEALAILNQTPGVVVEQV